MYPQTYLEQAHKACFANQESVLESEVCGCFSCLEVYPASAVEEWIEELPPFHPTAQCPRCSIDAVIASSTGYPVTDKEFLTAMQQLWF